MIEDAANELPVTARVVLQRAFDQWRELDEHLRWWLAVSCVGMANKNACILWAVMTREQRFDPGHLSAKPAAKLPAPPVSCAV